MIIDQVGFQKSMEEDTRCAGHAWQANIPDNELPDLFPSCRHVFA